MFIVIQQIKDSILKSPAKDNKLIIISVGLSIVFNICLWLVLYFKLKPISQELDPNIPLHYNIYFGIDYFGHWTQSFIMSGFGLFIILINTFLAFLIYLKEKFLSYFLIGVCLFSQIVLFIAGVLVVLLNI